MSRLQPLAPLLPLGAAAGRPLAAAPRNRQAIDAPPLSPEEEKSLLGRLAGGVQYVGETLDKPGAAVRGVLAGRPDQLLNLVPFSGSLGLTDAASRTSGRDLLEQVGLAAPDQAGLFNSVEDFTGDVGGFLLEVMLDPLMFVRGPLGAVDRTTAAAAKAAKAAKLGGKGVKEAAEGFGKLTDDFGGLGRNLTPSNWAEQITRGERGFFSIEAPGFLKGVIPGQQLIGTGKGAGKVAEVLSKAAFQNPASVAARSLFSVPVGGAANALAQKIKERAWAESNFMLRGLKEVVGEFASAEGKIFDEHVQKIADYHKLSGDVNAETAFRQVWREIREIKGEPSVEKWVESMAHHTQLSEDTISSLINADVLASRGDEVLNAMSTTERSLYDKSVALGLRVSKDGLLNDDFIGHAPRRATAYMQEPLAKQKISQQGREVLQTKGAVWEFGAGRNEMLRNAPGGSSTINRMGMDPLMNGTVGPGIKTLAEDAAKTIQPGAIVQAGGKKGFYGKVLHVKDEVAEVFTRNPDTGMSEIQKIHTKNLALGRHGAPEELTQVGVEHFRRGSKETRRKALARALGAGDEAKLKDLQEAYLNKGMADEARRTGWETAAEMRARTGKDVLSDADVETLKRTINGQSVTVEEYLEGYAKDQAPGLAKYLDKYGLEVAHGGLFDNRVSRDSNAYLTALIEKHSTLRSMHKYLDDVFKGDRGVAGGIRQPIDAVSDQGMVSLPDAWDDAGFGREGLRTFAVSHFSEAAAMKEAGKSGQLDKFVSNLLIDSKAAGPLAAFNEITRSQTQNAIVDMFDRATAVYRGMLTVSGGPLWGIAFHTRNLGSGMWQSWSDGKVSFKELMEGYGRAIRTARSAGKGGIDPKGLEFIDEFLEHNGLSGGGFIDIAGEVGGISEGIPKGPFGGTFGSLSPSNVTKAFRERGFQAANPFHTRGVFDNPKSLLGESGENAYKYVEYLNRAGYYDALRKKGVSVGEALESVKRSQFDYSDLTQFEKTFARRSALFYGWTRKNLPYQMAKLAAEPGGRSAQTIRLFGQADSDEYAPANIREGLAVRVGGDDRAATFLKQGGLPIEDLNKFVTSGGLPSGRTLQKLASQLHPFISMPVEMFAGKQLFSGREIKNLRSTTGALTEAFTGTPRPMPTADKLLQYSPVSRAAGEMLGLIDTRKPATQQLANMLTGLKFSTYDTVQQRLFDLNRAVRDELESSPSVREGKFYYVPEDQKQFAVAQTEGIRRLGALAKSIKNLEEAPETRATPQKSLRALLGLD